MIGRINHVAIAVRDLEAAMARYRDVLGAEVTAPRALPEHGVRVAFVVTGESEVELMEPLGPESSLIRFLEKHPDGAMHHVCFEVADLSAAARELVGKGMRLAGDGVPRTGARGVPVLFLHPKDFDGTLIELEECRPDFQPA